MANWKEHTIRDSRLILHCGGKEVAPAKVAEVITPEATASHQPIPHTMLLDKVEGALTHHGFSFEEAVHALYADGLRYFALLAIDHPNHHFEDGKWVLGLRNSHDQSFAASGMLGLNIFNCDNLGFHGGEQFSITRRKHTKNILLDIDARINESLGAMSMKMVEQEKRLEHYKDWSFTKAADEHGIVVERGTDGSILNNPFANDFLMRALMGGCVAPSRVKKVVREFYNPDGPGGHPELGGQTAWTMVNAFTEVHKEYPSLLESPRRDGRLTGMLDATTNLLAAADVTAITSTE
jgi:hypothetical protein